MTKQFTKTIAMALAAITVSLPFSTQALAASHNNNHFNPAHKIEWRHDQHKVQPQSHRYPAHHQKQEDHHSATGNFVTGAIIGGILGAIIAQNT